MVNVQELLTRAAQYDELAASLMPAAEQEYQRWLSARSSFVNAEGEPILPPAIAALAGLRDAAKHSRDLAAARER